MGKGGNTEIKETEGEKAIAAIAAEQYNHYMKYLKPLQDRFIEDVQVKSHDYDRNLGFGNIDSEASYAQTKPTAMPGGRTNLSANINRIAEGKSKDKAGGMVRSNMLSDDAYQSALQSIVDVGTGQSNSAQSGIIDTATNNFNQSLGSAQRRFNNWSSRQNDLGALAGMAAYQYGGGKKET